MTTYNMQLKYTGEYLLRFGSAESPMVTNNPILRSPKLQWETLKTYHLLVIVASTTLQILF